MKHSFTSLLCAASLLAVACGDDNSGAGDVGDTPTTDVDAGTASSDAPNDAGDSLTYSEHIAPMIAQHCTICHTDGGSGPFVLDDFESVTTFAPSLLASMESGQMPPWMPADDCNPIAHARSMHPDEIALFSDWIDQGMAAGPELPQPQPSTMTFEPTHAVGLAEPYTPSTDEADDYRCFLLDIEFDEPMYLTGSTVHPGNGLVHHVIVYALEGEQADAARVKDEAQEGPGYTCFGGPVPFGGGGGGTDLEAIADRLAGADFPGQLGAWVPGQTPREFADGVAMRIEAGTLLVMQVHYSALAGPVEPDAGTEFQAVLTSEEPEWLATTSPVIVRPLDIPAGEPEVVQSEALTYYGEESVRIGGMTPHMHLLGTSIITELERGDGTSECGLDIPDWDFDWQESYDFAEGHELLLVPGDAVRVTCTYDNSAANQPVVNGEQIAPRDVSWGDGTLDEMCLTYLHTIRPFSPPVEPGAAACSADCADECGPDLACLAACGDGDVRCFGCVLAESIDCGSSACLAQLVAAQRCLSPCVMSSILLGSNFGTCMVETCEPQFSTASECVNEYLGAEACAEARTLCGI